MKKVKVTIELEMTQKYYEDDYDELESVLIDNIENLTLVVNDIADFIDNKSCDVVDIEFEEVE